MTSKIDTAKEREKLAALEGHTTGPWCLDGIAVSSLRVEVCFMGEPAQYPGDMPVMLDNCEENARLIAAAPYLKATLATALDALDAKDAEIERLREALSILLRQYERGGGYSDQYSRQARSALYPKDTQ